MEGNCNMHNMKYQYENHSAFGWVFAEDLLLFAKIWFALPEGTLT